MSTLRHAIRPVLGLALITGGLSLSAESASAQIFGRRTVIIQQQPAYAVPVGTTVVTQGPAVSYAPTVYSSGVVPTGYSPSVVYGSGVVPTVYSPSIIANGPVPTAYTTTTVGAPAAVYAQPAPLMERVRYGPRRTVYRYYYPY